MSERRSQSGHQQQQQQQQPPPPGPKTYLVIFVSLMVLLAITVAAAFVDFNHWLPGNGWSIAIALGIAAAKGLLILLYFMHVKFGPRRAIVFAAAGFFWLAIMLTLTYSDYLTRNHPGELNFKGEPHFLWDMKN